MEEAPLELADLVRNLSSEGRFDSTGGFTLDLSHAVEKLKKYQLEDRASHYILKLVQCAVASGASAIHLNSNSHRVSLRMDAVSIPAEELQNLFSYILVGRKEHHKRNLRALAVGINSAIGVGAREISLTSWNGQNGVRQIWTQAGPSQRPFQGSGPAFVEFLLTRSFKDKRSLWALTANSDILDLLLRKRSAMDKEQAAVYDHCRLCPVPITMNGRLLEKRTFGVARYPGCPWPPARDDARARSFFSSDEEYQNGIHLKHHLIETYRPALSPDTVPTLVTPPSSSASLVKHFLPGEPFGFALGVPLRAPSVLSLHFAEDGVLIKGPTILENDGFGGTVLLCASQFEKDLSEFTVTVDEKYIAMQDIVGREARSLYVDILRNLDRYPKIVGARLETQIRARGLSGDT